MSSETKFTTITIQTNHGLVFNVTVPELAPSRDRIDDAESTLKLSNRRASVKVTGHRDDPVTRSLVSHQPEC